MDKREFLKRTLGMQIPPPVVEETLPANESVDIPVEWPVTQSVEPKRKRGRPRKEK